MNQERHYGRVVITSYMGAVFSRKFVNSKMAVTTVWQFITGFNVDACSEDNNTIIARWALHSADKDIVLYGKTKDIAFVPFWEELKRQLES